MLSSHLECLFPAAQRLPSASEDDVTTCSSPLQLNPDTPCRLLSFH